MHPYIGLDIMSGRIAVQLIRSSLPFNGGWIYYTLKSVADKFLSGAPERETIAWASLVVDRIAEPFCFGSTKRELQDLQRMLRDMLVLVCCSHDQESTLQNIEHAFEHASKAISPCLDIHRVPNWPALMHSYSKIVVQAHFLDWHLHLDRNAVRSRAVFLAHTHIAACLSRLVHCNGKNPAWQTSQATRPYAIGGPSHAWPNRVWKRFCRADVNHQGRWHDGVWQRCLRNYLWIQWSRLLRCGELHVFNACFMNDFRL